MCRKVKGEIFEIKLSVWKFMSAKNILFYILAVIELFRQRRWGFSVNACAIFSGDLTVTKNISGEILKERSTLALLVVGSRWLLSKLMDMFHQNSF